MENSDKLFDTISSKKMKQKPKWFFTLKNTFSWFLFIGFMLLGSISFSVILFAIQQADFDLLNHLSHSIFEFILSIAPIIWLITLLIFLIIAMLGIKNSKRGYKYSLGNILAFSIGFSILLGTLFFISGGGRFLDHAFETQFSTYRSIESMKISRWSNPENGYLSGTIISISDEEMEIKDFDQTKWLIDIKDAKIRGNKSIETGMKIKFIGAKEGDHIFKAKEIRQWGGNGKGPKRN